MSRFFKKYFDLEQSSGSIAESPYGLIEASHGKVDFVQLRPWPKLVSGVEALWLGGWSHRHLRRDRAQLWYSQPMAHRNFLVLSYIVSEMGTTALTLRAALNALDRIAELKRSDAILCQASNSRLTEPMMRYWGFERHLQQKKGRHYIRRFYGEYPPAKRSRGKSGKTKVQVD